MKLKYSIIAIISFIIFSLSASAYASEDRVELIKTLNVMESADNGNFITDIELTSDELADIGKKFGYTLNFYKGADITLNDVCVMLCDIAGYGSFLEDTSEAYKKATELGILKNISIAPDDGLTRSDMADVLYNFLKVEVIEKENMTYTYGDTVMQKFFRTDRFSGRMTANEYTALVGKTDCTANEVEIGGEKFIIHDFNVINYIGRYVVVYYSTDEDSYGEIKYIYCDDNKDKITEIKAEEVKSFKNNTLEYVVNMNTANSKTKTISIRADASVIYNGKSRASYDSSIFTFDDGSITVIENGSYQCILIKKYDNFKVTGKSSNMKKLYSGSKTILLDNTNYRIIDRKGNPLTYEDIETNNVLSVMQNGDIIEIIMSERISENFVISNITVSDGKTYLESTGGLKYQIAEYYMNSSDYIAPQYGKAYELYINYFGKIVYMKYLNETNKKIGVLVDIKYVTMDSGEDNVYIYIMGDDGKKYTYTADKKVGFVSEISNESVSCDYSKLYYKLKGKNELIWYRVYNDKITYIEMCPEKGVDDDSGELGKIFDGTVKRSGSGFGARFYSNSTTKYFYTSSDNFTDPDEYLFDTTYNHMRNEKSFEMKAYSFGRIFADYIIVYDADEKTDIPFTTTKFAVVQSISEGLDSNNEVKVKIDLNDGSVSSIYCDEELLDKAYDLITAADANPVYHTVEVGDIIRYKTDIITGDVIGLEILFKPNIENPAPPDGTKGAFVGSNMIYGAVNEDGTTAMNGNPFMIDAEHVLQSNGLTTTNVGNRVLYGWVYEAISEGSWVRYTTQDLGAENAVFEDYTYEIGNAGWITVLDTIPTNAIVVNYSEYTVPEVKKGSISDVRAYRDYGNDCSRIITVHTGWSSKTQTFILN